MYRSFVLGWFLLLLTTLALYSLTANLGIQGRDAGYYIMQALHGDLRAGPGLAVAHPLHFWLGRLLLFFNFAPAHYSLTLLSGTAAAITVANTFGCVTTITRNIGAGVFAAVSLALAHTFWQMATIAEVYTLTTALLSLEIWCVFCSFRRCSWLWLGAACFLNGLGIVNHLQAALTTPALAILLVLSLKQTRLSISQLPLCCLLWVVGALPYMALICHEYMSTLDMGTTIRSALFANSARQVLNVGLSKRMLMTGTAFPLLNFPNLLLPFAACGLICFRRLGISTPVHVYFLLGLALHLLFVVRYRVGDQYTFFLPVYLFLTILGGCGWAWLIPRLKKARRQIVITLSVLLLAFTPLVYLFASNAARDHKVLEGIVKDRPNEDKYVRIFIPWSCADQAVDRTVAEAVGLASPNGLIVIEHNWYYGSAFWYWQQARGGEERGELHIVSVKQAKSTHIDPRWIIRQAVRQQRVVVLVPEEVGQQQMDLRGFRWLSEADLFVLEP